jgi:hypothetical protein
MNAFGFFVILFHCCSLIFDEQRCVYFSQCRTVADVAPSSIRRQRCRRQCRHFVVVIVAAFERCQHNRRRIRRRRHDEVSYANSADAHAVNIEMIVISFEQRECYFRLVASVTAAKLATELKVTLLFLLTLLIRKTDDLNNNNNPQQP